MDTDGHKNGYDLPLTRAISEAVEVPVVASGGCGKPQHMVDAVIEGKADAVLAASIFHFGEYSIAGDEAAYGGARRACAPRALSSSARTTSRVANDSQPPAAAARRDAC